MKDWIWVSAKEQGMRHLLASKQAIIALELQWFKVMLTKTCWSNNINTVRSEQFGTFLFQIWPARAWPKFVMAFNGCSCNILPLCTFVVFIPQQLKWHSFSFFFKYHLHKYILLMNLDNCFIIGLLSLTRNNVTFPNELNLRFTVPARFPPFTSRLLYWSHVGTPSLSVACGLTPH